MQQQQQQHQQLQNQNAAADNAARYVTDTGTDGNGGESTQQTCLMIVVHLPGSNPFY